MDKEGRRNISCGVTSCGRRRNTRLDSRESVRLSLPAVSVSEVKRQGCPTSKKRIKVLSKLYLSKLSWIMTHLIFGMGKVEEDVK